MQVLNRPYETADLEPWRLAMCWSTDDANWALGQAWTNVVRRDNEPVSFDLEVLLRLYDRDPAPPVFGSSAMSTKELIRQYEPVLQHFRDPESRAAARVMIDKRFAALLGRTVSATRRWTQSESKTRVVTQILAKLTRESDPLSVLTEISKKAWLLRGVNLDLTCPLPSSDNPPILPRLGRPAKSLALA